MKTWKTIPDIETEQAHAQIKEFLEKEPLEGKKGLAIFLALVGIGFLVAGVLPFITKDNNDDFKAAIINPQDFAVVPADKQASLIDTLPGGENVKPVVAEDSAPAESAETPTFSALTENIESVEPVVAPTSVDAVPTAETATATPAAPTEEVALPAAEEETEHAAAGDITSDGFRVNTHTGATDLTGATAADVSGSSLRGDLTATAKTGPETWFLGALSFALALAISRRRGVAVIE